MNLRVFDYAFILIAAALTGAVAFLVYANSKGAPRVVITAPNASWQYPLSATATIPAKGPLGITTVLIQNNSARITASPCPSHSCIAAGPISQPGAFIACLPNRVMVAVEANNNTNSENSVDAGVW